MQLYLSREGGMDIISSSRFLSKCDHCAVHYPFICEDIDDSDKAELSRISHFRNYSEGETVIADGDEVGFVGDVVSGVLKMIKALPDGRQHIVGLIHPAGMFGRVFESKARFAIEAATDVRLCCFDRQAFEILVSRNPEFEHKLLLISLNELDEARDWTMLLGCQSILERVATFIMNLLHLKEHQGCGPSKSRIMVELPICRQDTAAYLGTTSETLSRSIHVLARRGIIRIIDSQHFEIIQVGRLAILSGREEFVSEAKKRVNTAFKVPAERHSLHRSDIGQNSDHAAVIGPGEGKPCSVKESNPQYS
jgi:CRP/FNR family transcriptional regulator